MVRLSLIRGGVTVAMLAALAATCSDPGTRSPVSPRAPTPVSVEISGPATIAPGQTAQYTAVVVLSDGTRKPVTADTPLIWRSNQSSVQVDHNSGVATGVAAGDAALSVDLTAGSVGGTKRGTKEVVVVPDGTYRMVGVVRDAEFPDLGIPNARLEVTPGLLVATTGGDGRYRVYGVPADAELTVSADGYLPVVKRVQLAGHASEDVLMSLPGARLGLSGHYTLTIDAADTCAALAPELRHREYRAVVTQDGFRLEVTLTEPEFKLNAAGKGHRFNGQAVGSGATFTLDDFDYYYASTYPSLVEALSDGSVFVAGGRATTTESAVGLSGTLIGILARWNLTVPFPTYLGGCFANSHRFALTPR